MRDEPVARDRHLAAELGLVQLERAGEVRAVLEAVTFSAPAMRLSSETLNLTPSFSATVCASIIMFAASSRVSGNRQMSTSVACARLLIGLKVRLPHSLSQISARMLSRIGSRARALASSSMRVAQLPVRQSP